MSQFFHPAANSIARVSIVVGALAAGGAALLVMVVLPRSSYVTRQYVERQQPVPFYHAHHVGSMGIDCRYCHTSVAKSARAGIPPTATCMNCHSQIWNQSPTLEPVRESWRTNEPLEWVKVHDLPDFVYFNHSAHVNKGVGCSTCHGRVDKMSFVWQEQSLLMEWCLECHRAPERFLRPKDEVYNIAYEAPANQLEVGRQLVEEYDVNPQVTCSTCHR
jgi:hypothetical protein